MSRDTLLPGVTSSSVPPVTVCNTRVEILRARRRAILRDVLSITLIVAVDLLFIRWPDAHVPILGRDGSVALLRMLNMAFVAHLWLARALPRWTARRIASTWCRQEQRRFFDDLR